MHLTAWLHWTLSRRRLRVWKRSLFWTVTGIVCVPSTMTSRTRHRRSSWSLRRRFIARQRTQMHVWKVRVLLGKEKMRLFVSDVISLFFCSWYYPHWERRECLPLWIRYYDACDWLCCWGEGWRNDAVDIRDVEGLWVCVAVRLSMCGVFGIEWAYLVDCVGLGLWHCQQFTQVCCW